MCTCGRFDNCVGVFVICVPVFTVFCAVFLCCFVYVYLLFVSSVLMLGLLSLSEKFIAVHNNNKKKKKSIHSEVCLRQFLSPPFNSQ